MNTFRFARVASHMFLVILVFQGIFLGSLHSSQVFSHSAVEGQDASVLRTTSSEPSSLEAASPSAEGVSSSSEEAKEIREVIGRARVLMLQYARTLYGIVLANRHLYNRLRMVHGTGASGSASFTEKVLTQHAWSESKRVRSTLDRHGREDRFNTEIDSLVDNSSLLGTLNLSKAELSAQLRLLESSVEKACSVVGASISYPRDENGSLYYILQRIENGIYELHEVLVELETAPTLYDKVQKLWGSDFLAKKVPVALHGLITFYQWATYLRRLSHSLTQVGGGTTSYPRLIASVFLGRDLPTPEHGNGHSTPDQLAQMQIDNLADRRRRELDGLVMSLIQRIAGLLQMSQQDRNRERSMLLRQDQQIIADARQHEVVGEPTRFHKVVGLASAKERVGRTIEAMRNPLVGKYVGVEPPRGILLIGPPGTGKTMLARAIAGEASDVDDDTPVRFFAISLADLLVDGPHSVRKKLEALFKVAQQSAPSVIFIDEFDCISPKKDAHNTLLQEFLVTLDGFRTIHPYRPVLFIGALNYPENLDQGLRERFAIKINVELPDHAARIFFFERELKYGRRRVAELCKGVSFDALADMTRGLSGRQILSLIHYTLQQAQCIGNPLTTKDFERCRDELCLVPENTEREGVKVARSRYGKLPVSRVMAGRANV